MHLSPIIVGFVFIGSSLAVPVTGRNAHPDHPGNMFGKRYVDCGTSCTCATSDANALANQLIGDGTESSGVNSGSWQLIDSYGSCSIWGQSTSGQYTSSYAQDVGYGAQSIIQGCALGDNIPGSTGYVGGNGDFQILIGACTSID